MDKLENAESYVKEFSDIYGRLNNIGQNREDVALSILQIICKDRRCAEMSKNKNADTPATKKQLDYLKDLGVQVDKNLTKQEASQMIEQKMNGKK